VVGTTSGTLGVLNTQDHSYLTLLRSHTKCITAIVSNPSGDELASLSTDGSIRIWDTVSLEQKYEFTSTADEPTCAAFHPMAHTLAVGFKSGVLRIFDINSTSVSFERQCGEASSCALIYSRCGTKLFAASNDSSLSVFETITSHTCIKSLSLSSTEGQLQPIYLALNCDGSLLACTGSKLNSLCVLDTIKLQLVFRACNISGGSPATPMYRPSTDARDFSDSNNTMGSTLVKHASPRESAEATKAQAAVGEVVGVCFYNDTKELRDYIILASSKCIVSVPVFERAANPSPIQTNNDDEKTITYIKSSAFDFQWSELSTKRVEFGVPKSLRKDSSGLLIMLVQAPDSKLEGANGFVVASIKLKTALHSFRSSISLSSSQLYQQPGGSAFLTSVASCVDAQKMIAVDNTGAMYVWRIKPATAMSSSSPILSTPEVSKSSMCYMSVLTADFEDAAAMDPHVWSAESHQQRPDASPMTRSNNGDYERLMYETPEGGSTALVEAGASIVVDQGRVKIDEDGDLEDGKGAEDSLMLHTSSCDLSVLLTDDIMSPLPSSSRSRDTQDRERFEEDYSKSCFIEAVDLLAHHVTMMPQYCQLTRAMLTCDGSALYLNDLALGKGVFLVGDVDASIPSSSIGVIFESSLAPNGSIVAVLTGARLNVKDNESRFVYVRLQLWALDDHRVWVFVGSFPLREDVRSFHLDWTKSSDLVLFMRLESANGRAAIHVLSAEHCGSKAAVLRALKAPEISLQLRGTVENCLVLNGVVHSLNDRALYLLLWGGGRMHLARLDNDGQNKDAIILWTEVAVLPCNK
jgi:WD40 repeat protein